MDVLHLQAMLGHASLDMVQHYAQMVDDDLLQSHQAHSPIDNLARPPIKSNFIYKYKALSCKQCSPQEKLTYRLAQH